MFSKFFSLFTGRSASQGNPTQNAAPAAVAVEEVPQQKLQAIYEFRLRNQHTLSELEQGGCQRKFGTFNPEDRNYSVPSTVYLVQIPRWKNLGWIEGKHWAPYGYRPLGVDALVSFGVEHPDVQRLLVVVATGAVDEPSESSAIYYLHLTKDENGDRIVSVPNWGVCWEGDNKKEGEESNFYGLFEKTTSNW